jgi:glucose/arabinose dehydrogenase
MRARPRRVAALVLFAATAAGACGDDGQDRSAPRTSRPPASTTTTATTGSPPGTTAQPQPLASLRGKLRLTTVATAEEPTGFAVRAGDDALYLTEKTGRVRAVRRGRLDPTPVLDLSDEVSGGSEQGLLGLAFSPDGTKLYVNYTDTRGDTRVVEYAVAGGRADTRTRRQLLFVDQPYANHNGGHLLFGPDGLLWIGLGDGGSAGDPHDNGQSLGTLLGKMLRIDPRPAGGRPYGIPADNPFVGRDGARAEIWAFGLRNPWRYSFDRATRDLWIGDVGQNAWEEIDFVAAGSRGGENYGWARVEGNHRFKGDAPPGSVPAIHEYRNGGEACSVTGGHVYRGSRIPGLSGAYLFADFCAGDVMGLRQTGGRVTELADLGLHAENLSSFGEDAAGELYVLSLDGRVSRIDPA